MKGILSKVGRQTGFPVYPIARRTMVLTLGVSESEINWDLSFASEKGILFLNLSQEHLQKTFWFKYLLLSATASKVNLYVQKQILMHWNIFMELIFILGNIH